MTVFEFDMAICAPDVVVELAAAAIEAETHGLLLFDDASTSDNHLETDKSPTYNKLELAT
jgi:hypothetical protein